MGKFSEPAGPSLKGAGKIVHSAFALPLTLIWLLAPPQGAATVADSDSRLITLLTTPKKLLECKYNNKKSGFEWRTNSYTSKLTAGLEARKKTAALAPEIRGQRRRF